MDEDAHAPDTATGPETDQESSTPIRPPIPPYPHDFGILSKKPGSSLRGE